MDASGSTHSWPCRATIRLGLAAALLAALPAQAPAAPFELVEATISELQAAYAAGKITAVQAVKKYLKRIEKQDVKGAKLNSVIVNPDALAEAAEADRLRKAGVVLGPLHGIPVVVKDSYAVEGMPTTNGIEGWKALIAPRDAFNVNLLREAGAIIIGKANMSTFAFSYDGISEAWGQVGNPYNPNRTPGGSSSGTGAAIGANFAMFGMGGETGGSIRVPSDFQGLSGLKPTLGLLSADGTVPLSPMRDVIGPLAKSVTDVALAMDVLAQKDPDDLYAPEYLWDPTPEQPERRPPTYTAFLDSNALQGKVLGVLKPYIGKGTPELGISNPIDPEVALLWERAAAELEAEGATLVEVTPPAHTLWFVDRVNNTPAWQPIGYPPTWDVGAEASGSRGSATYYYDAFLQEFGVDPYLSLPAVAPLIPSTTNFLNFYNGLIAAYDLGNLVPHTDPLAQQYLAAIKKLRIEYLDAWMEAEGLDALVCPTMKIPAFKQLADPGIAIYGDSLNARFESNILGLPAITVPAGFYFNNVPGTIQFIGSFYGEGEIIGYAYDYEQATAYRMGPRLRAARRIRECADLAGGRCDK